MQWFAVNIAWDTGPFRRMSNSVFSFQFSDFGFLTLAFANFLKCDH